MFFPVEREAKNPLRLSNGNYELLMKHGGLRGHLLYTFDGPLDFIGEFCLGFLPDPQRRLFQQYEHPYLRDVLIQAVEFEVKKATLAHTAAMLK